MNEEVAEALSVEANRVLRHYETRMAEIQKTLEGLSQEIQGQTAKLVGYSRMAQKTRKIIDETEKSQKSTGTKVIPVIMNGEVSGEARVSMSGHRIHISLDDSFSAADIMAWGAALYIEIKDEGEI